MTHNDTYGLGEEELLLWYAYTEQFEEIKQHLEVIMQYSDQLP